MGEFKGISLPQNDRTEWVAYVWRAEDTRDTAKRELCRGPFAWSVEGQLREWLEAIKEAPGGPRRERLLRKVRL